MKKITVTIDGPAGAGKSTVAREVAKRIGLPYLDTGAIYRAISFELDRKGILPDEDEKIAPVISKIKIEITRDAIFANGTDVTKAIRTERIDKVVSAYAAKPIIRKALLELQREHGNNGIVADGRDMGTVVFPDAELKIFLTASAEERAKRRFKERIDKGESVNYDEILKQVIERDRYDMSRETSPLRPAQGCIILDSTTMSAEEVIDVISSLAIEMCEKSAN